MSNADRMTLAYITEDSFGVPPATPAMQEIRFTGESLKLNIATQDSAEIRGDRQLADVKRTDQSEGGGFNFEASYGNLDGLLAALLYSAGWSSPETTGALTTLSAAAGSGTYTIMTASAGTPFAAFAVGQWVEIRGFASALLNGYGKITAKTDTAITVKGNGDGDTESAGASVTIVMGGQIVNGVSQSSIAWEKYLPDATGNAYVKVLGWVPESLSLTIEAGAIITGTMDGLGKSEESAASSIRGSTVAAPTNGVMSAVEDIAAVLEGYATYATKRFSIEIKNNNRARTQVASLGPVSIGAGQIGVNGSLHAYFASHATLDKYRNFTASSVAGILEDSAGNVYIFDIPNLNFTDGQQLAGGKNTDIMAELSYTAKRHVTEDVTIRIVRFPA